MGQLLRKAAAYIRVLSKARHNRLNLLRYAVRRPAILLAIGGYETALFASGRVDFRIKALASVKASSMIGCPF